MQYNADPRRESSRSEFVRPSSSSFETAAEGSGQRASASRAASSWAMVLIPIGDKMLATPPSDHAAGEFCRERRDQLHPPQETYHFKSLLHSHCRGSARLEFRSQLETLDLAGRSLREIRTELDPTRR